MYLMYPIIYLLTTLFEQKYPRIVILGIVVKIFLRALFGSSRYVITYM